MCVLGHARPAAAKSVAQADAADIRGKEREQYQKALAQLNKLRADAEVRGARSTPELMICAEGRRA